MPLLIFAAMLADGIMAAAKKTASGQQLKVKRRNPDMIINANESGRPSPPQIELIGAALSRH
jgi:hypothetical protein